MKDFVQHRLALERAWQDTLAFEDTEPMSLDEIAEPNFKPDLNVSPLDDLYSDVVWVTVLMYAGAILYLTFGA